MTSWLRLLSGYDVLFHRRVRTVMRGMDTTGACSATQPSADPPWLTWLVQGLAQVPPRHSYVLFPRHFYLSAYCVQCGQWKEPLAYDAGSTYCQRCARAKVRHLIEAEFRG